MMPHAKEDSRKETSNLSSTFKFGQCVMSAQTQSLSHPPAQATQPRSRGKLIVERLSVTVCQCDMWRAREAAETRIRECKEEVTGVKKHSVNGSNEARGYRVRRSTACREEYPTVALGRRREARRSGILRTDVARALNSAAQGEKKWRETRPESAHWQSANGAQGDCNSRKLGDQQPLSERPCIAFKVSPVQNNSDRKTLTRETRNLNSMHEEKFCISVVTLRWPGRKTVTVRSFGPAVRTLPEASRASI
jgi:hypothetical protein